MTNRSPEERRPIYMDHNATTPVLPEVVEAMLPYFTCEFGNASSSTHAYGRRAAEAVDAARKDVADLIGARSSEIIFTAGATESDNMAVRGVALASRARGNHVITCGIEHEAVLESCHLLEGDGFDVSVLPVDGHGLLEPDDVRRAITAKTVLVSVMLANNEIGTIEPIAEIGRICRERGVPLHTDAVQGAGRIPLDVDDLSVDLMALTAHKMYGPKGVGALFVRAGVPMTPLLAGGGQERKLRSGTLNVPGVVGFAAAARAALRDMPGESARQENLRDRLWQEIQARVDDVALNGPPVRRLPNNLNVAFRSIEAEAMLTALREVAALSSGSACASGSAKGSYVIRALGAGEERARCSIRFGLGRSNTEEDVYRVVDHVARAARRLRAISPLVG